MYSEERHNLSVPKVAVVDDADDIAFVAIAKHLKDAGLYLCEAISATKVWLTTAGLALAEEQTKPVLITERFKRNFTRIRIGITSSLSNQPGNTWK